eukprot:COSAG02_NODE_214_length_28689_cov_34.895523_3_plen_416_part_00
MSSRFSRPHACAAICVFAAQSTHFLRAELPTRLHILRSMACVLPAECARLPSVAAWDEALAAHCAPHSEPPPAELSDHVPHSDAVLLQGLAADAVEEVNTRLQHLGADMQLWVASRSSSQYADYNEQLLTHRRIDAFFSRAHYVLIGLRLLSASQGRASAMISGSCLASAGAGGDEELISRCSVVDVIQHSVEDARAFAREKYGVVPDVLVHSSQPRQDLPADELQPLVHRAVCVESQLAFVIHEVLKNSMTSHNLRYGIDADLGPEVVIEVGQGGGRAEEIASQPRHIEIVMRDHGHGMTPAQCGRALSWLSTKVEQGEGGVSRRLDNNEHWKYTREMGAQFSGLGVGLPLARTYCWLMGGDLTLSASPAPAGGDDDGDEGGTTVTIRIDPFGDTWWTPDMAKIGARELMAHEA